MRVPPRYEPNLGMKFLHNSKLIRFFEKLLAEVTINCYQKLPRIASYKMCPKLPKTVQSHRPNTAQFAQKSHYNDTATL